MEWQIFYPKYKSIDIKTYWCILHIILCIFRFTKIYIIEGLWGETEGINIYYKITYPAICQYNTLLPFHHKPSMDIIYKDLPKIQKLEPL